VSGLELPEVPDMESLFPELEAALPPGRPGRVEALLLRSIEAAQKASTLVVEDWGLVGGCLAAARALDTAERGGRGGGPYAVAALLSPYREALQALRLPAVLAPAEAPRPPAGTPVDASSLLGDIFGTPQPPG
jgi:hypothetical protein